MTLYSSRSTRSICPLYLGTISRAVIAICDDGLLGDFEWSRYPHFHDHTSVYTACIEIPTDDEAAKRLRFRTPTLADTEEDAEPDERDPNGILCYGRKDGTYRMVKDIHKKMHAKTQALQNNFDRAQALSQTAFTKYLPPEGSVTRTICQNMRPPTKEVSGMWTTWAIARWGNLRTMEDFILCIRAHQRAVAVVNGYIDFLHDFLPVEYRGPLVKRAQRRPSNVTYRGSILTGDEIEMLLPWYALMGVPVFALVRTAQYDIPRSLFRSPSEPRCSLETTSFRKYARYVTS